MGVVLAAGSGSRLRPLTDLRPKALCPVGDVPLVDLALERVVPITGEAAVNVHHGRAQLEAHLSGRAGVHLSIEEAAPLGTAGALGELREWIAGRGALVVNADSWTTASLGPFVEGWDGDHVRILIAGPGEFGPGSLVVASLIPWALVSTFDAEPSGLYEICWSPEAARGYMEVVAFDGPFVDCGTPDRYLEANLRAADLAGGMIIGAGARVTGSATHSVVGHHSVVDGEVTDCVVWDSATVEAGERLERVVRATAGITVSVGPS